MQILRATAPITFLRRHRRLVIRILELRVRDFIFLRVTPFYAFLLSSLACATEVEQLFS